VTKSILKPGRQRDWEKQLFSSGNFTPTQIWRNVLNPNSLRLTVGAYRSLLIHKVLFYNFQLDSMTNLQLLQLDRLFESPYFIKDRKHLELLGERDSIMLQLHGNNLKQYLDNLANESICS
jgi:hypothetical protein